MRCFRSLIIGGRQGGIGYDFPGRDVKTGMDFGEHVSVSLSGLLEELQKHPLRWSYAHVDALGLELPHPNSEDIFSHQGFA